MGRESIDRLSALEGLGRKGKVGPEEVMGLSGGFVQSEEASIRLPLAGLLCCVGDVGEQRIGGLVVSKERLRLWGVSTSTSQTLAPSTVSSLTDSDSSKNLRSTSPPSEAPPPGDAVRFTTPPPLSVPLTLPSPSRIRVPTSVPRHVPPGAV